MTKPVLAQQTDYGRAYVHPLTGEAVPSVTTLINVIHKPALVPWKAKMAAEYAVKNWEMLSGLPESERVPLIREAADRYASRASDHGTLIHEICDAWATGKPYPNWSSKADSSMNQFIEFLTAIRPRFVENEFTVWSRQYGYAGTADALLDIGGEMVLADWKTGARVYPEVGLQLSALANADFILRPDGTEDPLPGITRMAALHLRPRSWRLVNIYESGECFRAFRAAIEIFRWQQETAGNVLGSWS